MRMHWIRPFPYLAYVLLFLFFAAMMTNYRFEIMEDALVYEVRILSLVISKRVIKSTEVEKVHSIHVGPRTIVLIHPKKGMRIKLHRFVPAGIDKEVEQFARQHALPIKRTGEKQ